MHILKEYKTNVPGKNVDCLFFIKVWSLLENPSVKLRQMVNHVMTNSSTSSTLSEKVLVSEFKCEYGNHQPIWLIFSPIIHNSCRLFASKVVQIVLDY